MIETVLIVGGILLIAGLAWLIFRTETRGGVNGEGGGLAPEFERFERELRVAIADGRKEVLEAAKTQREELSTSISRLASQHQDDQRGGREEMAAILKRFGENVDQRLRTLTEANDKRFAEVRQTLEEKLKALQDDNAQKLEKMRETVDEKLHATLELRLSESFKVVSERLEAVHKGLGEMQTLAAGVGDLKRVLTNVKTGGTWGEIQLGSLLEQVLAPSQFDRNVVTKKGSNDRVEFAIKFPGRGGNNDVVWLPIDAKFPRVDYENLIGAQERGDIAAADEASRQLENRIKTEAKTVRDKYIDPPNTTDFALIFLPTEGLYAEIARRASLVDVLQREYKVTVAGPSNLMALLNSLQMGFRTLAIEKRSSEVWELLAAVKTEFGKFADNLAKTKKKLEEATNTIGSAEVRTRAITRKLRGVEELPEQKATNLLEAEEVSLEEPDVVEIVSKEEK
jgi:DNA recombination protein RmuC